MSRDHAKAQSVIRTRNHRISSGHIVRRLLIVATSNWLFLNSTKSPTRSRWKQLEKACQG